jgi:cytochrome c oxidase subunit II
MKTKFIAPLFIAVLFTAIVFSSRVHAQEAPQRIEIAAQRFRYTPNEITLKKGVPVVLAITSNDVNHGMKFKELDLDIKIKKHATTEVPFTPEQVGTFVGQCSVFCGSGHGSMKMIFHVTE